jgi:two-component system chemotaxis response regulator CheB
MSGRNKGKINVLVVEDSPVVRELLVHILSSDPNLQVIGTAVSGEEALEALKRIQPDVITMDIHMPKMDGFGATRAIMETRPIPIVIVSGSSTTKEATTAFRAIEAGALAVVETPKGIGHPEHEAAVVQLVQTVKLMSEVKVIRRWARHRREVAVSAGLAPAEVGLRRQPAEIGLLAIGASTGGPVVLQTILAGLPRDLPVPVLIVQHMAPGFIQGFVDWLSETSSLPVHVASQGERILAGHAYVAPDGVHLTVRMGGVISLTHDEPENGLRPAVSHLFRSVTNVYGPSSVGVLLTGMGKDGAEELKLMRGAGAVTIAQDKESSVVHGMPGEAIKLDAACYVLSPDSIATVLTSLARGRQG